MHRSGTSWLAGSLEQAGLELGEVNTAAAHNRKGNRENRDLQELHEAVLKDNGGSWRNPTWPNRWSRKRRTQLARHIAAMSEAYPLWGFKDPRTLLVLDEWHDQVETLTRVGIYRHPIAVYRSLHARHDDFTEEEAFRIWQIYNERLLDEHGREAFPILRFDVDPATLRSQAESAAADLHLGDPSRSEAFFDAGLVHNNEDAHRSLPAGVADVWSSLEERAIYRSR